MISNFTILVLNMCRDAAICKTLIENKVVVCGSAQSGHDNLAEFYLSNAISMWSLIL